VRGTAATTVSNSRARGSETGFGARLYRLRSSRRLTLQVLGARAGLAPSTISKIENGRMSPTYDLLLKLAAGLGLDIVELLRGDGANPAPAGAPAAEPTALGRLDVTRSAARRKQSAAGVYVYEPLAIGLSRKAMDPTLMTVTARSIGEFADLVRHPGEEFVYVLSGAVEFHSEFYAPLRLGPGDGLYFDGLMGHAYVSIGAENATILNIVCSGMPRREARRPARKAAAQISKRKNRRFPIRQK